MQHFIQDLKYGARILVRRPVFAAVALLTLALGIGAATVVFSVVNAVLLRPLPLVEPDKVVRIEEGHGGPSWLNLTGANFKDVRDHSESFSHLAAYRVMPFNLSGTTEPEIVSVARSSQEFFGVLGAHPLHGRLFDPLEFRTGADRVVILSEAIWTRRYGGDPGVAGQRVTLDGEPYLVAGVLPNRFCFPDGADLWMPLSDQRALPQNRRSHLFVTVGRLRDGISVERAGSELESLAGSITEASGNIDEGMKLRCTSLQDRMTADVRPALLAMLGAVGFLLLIACANVANLLLSRGAAREKEFAIRAALGATRLRLIRQLLSESLLLGLTGGLLGVLAAIWGLDGIRALSPENVPRLKEANVDLSVLVFSFLVSLIAAVMFGLSPAFHHARADLQPSLKEGGRSSSMSSRRMRSILIVSECAIALVLLAGAGLLLRSFVELLRVDLGFRTENVLTSFVSPAGAHYRSETNLAQFYESALEEIRKLPAVEAAAVSNAVPSLGLPATTFEIEGRQNIAGAPEPSADVLAVSPDYFRAMAIPLRRGRGFAATDRGGAPVAVILSQMAAESFWPDQDPIGKHLTMLHWDEPLRGEVVGVVADVRQRGMDEAIEPAVYFSMSQFAARILGGYFIVHTRSAPLEMATAVRDRVWSVDPNQPVGNVQTLEQVLSESVVQERFNVLLLTLFAVLALALVTVGVYGVVSYSVSERTSEIGIRVSLGAGRRDIFMMVFGQGMKLVTGGIMIGLLGAVAATRVLESMLFSVSATDPATLVFVSIVLAGTGLVACYVPAVRAVKVDPLVALRHE